MKYNELKNLTTEELHEILEIISNILMDKTTTDYSQEDHLSKGIVCPCCGSIHCVKNGNTRGKQRFLCRDCNKTFGVTTASPLANTKLSHSKWQSYIKYMIAGYSIRACAQEVGVSVKTSFYMRHRILEAIEQYIESKNTNVGGIVEMDGTYIAESFKGNHKKSGFIMPRSPHKRGKDSIARGISNAQICIATAIDRDNNIIMTAIDRGRTTTKALCDFYNGRVNVGSTICTDGFSGYVKLAEVIGLVHKKMEHEKISDPIFNLSHINSLHSRFKKWMKRFNGVSTKRLSHYLAWFQWIELNKGLSKHSSSKQLWKDALACNVDTRICTIRAQKCTF